MPYFEDHNFRTNTLRIKMSVGLDTMHQDDTGRSTSRFGTYSVDGIRSYQEQIIRLKDGIVVSNHRLPLAIHHFGNSLVS